MITVEVRTNHITSHVLCTYHTSPLGLADFKAATTRTRTSLSGSSFRKSFSKQVSVLSNPEVVSVGNQV